MKTTIKHDHSKFGYSEVLSALHACDILNKLRKNNEFLTVSIFQHPDSISFEVRCVPDFDLHNEEQSIEAYKNTRVIFIEGVTDDSNQ